MKKLLLLLFQSSYASDAITIDSIFKNNNGFRNVTTLEFISSSGSRKYTSYPALIGIDDGEILVDSKTVAMNETFMYGFNSKMDLVLSANGSYSNLQYADSNGFNDKSKSDFSSLWVGVNYQFSSILGEFKLVFNFQLPIFEKDYYRDMSNTSSLKAFSSKVSLRNYSDPLVTTFYISALKNFE